MSGLRDELLKNAAAQAAASSAAIAAESPAGPQAPQFDDVEPGVKARALPVCIWRGRTLRERDFPCCGGKVRREFEFECAWAQNKVGRAWSMQCVANYGVCRGADGKEPNG